MKTLAEQIAVMQAALDGRAVECRYKDTYEKPYNNEPGEPWLPYNGEHNFDWAEFDYRVVGQDTKPAPDLKPVLAWIERLVEDHRIACQRVKDLEAQVHHDAEKIAELQRKFYAASDSMPLWPKDPPVMP